MFADAFVIVNAFVVFVIDVPFFAKSNVAVLLFALFTKFAIKYTRYIPAVVGVRVIVVIFVWTVAFVENVVVLIALEYVKLVLLAVGCHDAFPFASEDNTEPDAAPVGICKVPLMRTVPAAKLAAYPVPPVVIVGGPATYNVDAVPVNVDAVVVGASK